MIKLNMRQPFSGASVFFKPETESTQTDVKNLASQGLPSGTVVMAGHQLAGRGRFADRKWSSAPGESLVFSLLVQLKDFPPVLDAVSLRIGLALALAFEKELKLEPCIKWPNDVLLKNRKVAGILVESREEHMFIGIGVNCGRKSYPKDLKKTAISLQEAGSPKCAPDDILLPILRELKNCLFEEGFAWKEEIEKRLYAKGEVVTFLPGLSDGSGLVSAQLLGIQDDGQLLLRPEGSAETLAFANGELRWTPPKKGLFDRLKKA
jgi:BirA family biotin operon repressor/biotin-[acetyl-CoA-carboxylase] ligase